MLRHAVCLTARLTAAGAIGAAMIVTAAAPVTGEGASATFGLVAAADGLRLAAVVPGAPGTDQLVDTGGLRAQAALDGLGTSTATAGVLHPGDLAAGVPAFIRSQSGVPAPDVPLLAVSSHPTSPEGSAGAGPFTARAHSDGRSSSAQAAIAGPDDPPRGVSDATVQRADDGTVAAEATSLIEGFRAGPLTLGRVAVRSSASRAAQGTLQRTASFEVSAAEIAGSPVGIGAQGLVLPGTQVPLPDTSPLRAALEEHGVSMAYLAGAETADGVVSPGLQVSVRADASLAGTGASSLTWTLGRAVAAASSVTADLIPGPGSGDGPVPETAPPADGGPAAPAGVALPGPPDAGEAAPVRSDEPLAGGGYGDGPGTAPLTGTAGPAAALAAPVTVPAGSDAGPRRGPDRWPTSFYVAIAVAAVGVLGTGQAIRALGVRDLWTS